MQKTESFKAMAKTALLVEFAPRTRVIVNVPDGMSVRQYLENGENFDNLVKQAREQMLWDIENYLDGDNVTWEEDTECPFGTFNSD